MQRQPGKSRIREKLFALELTRARLSLCLRTTKKHRYPNYYCNVHVKGCMIGSGVVILVIFAVKWSTSAA